MSENGRVGTCWNCFIRGDQRVLHRDGDEWICAPCRDEIDFVIAQGKQEGIRKDSRDAERMVEEITG